MSPLIINLRGLAVVTSFDLARKDINFLMDLAWSCIIVDEVHRVKNPKSKLTDAFNGFLCKTRFGLTGTGMHNKAYQIFFTGLVMQPFRTRFPNYGLSSTGQTLEA